MTGEKLESWEKCREVGNLAKSWSRMGYGGGGFLSEAGLRERAQAEGRVSGAGAEGVRSWAFSSLFGVGTLVFLGTFG